MRRKPGILTLAPVHSHGLPYESTSKAPAWWRAVTESSKSPFPGRKLHDDDDNDNDNNADRHGKQAITISQRDHHRHNSRDDEQEKTRRNHHYAAPGVRRDPATMASWAGQPSVKGSTETTRMAMLTCASMGIAFTWGVEMTYCTPYLLSLGLTKGQASIVWLAGPLSGLIVQPVVGVISDQSTLKWGRRRPFMVVGSVIVACGLLTLGFTREIVTFLLGDGHSSDVDAPMPVPVPTTASPHPRLVITLAVLSLYVTDFAINAVMSCARSLLVDTLPIEKQQDGAAWASRMSSLGHLIGYAAGAVDLVYWLGPAYGNTQFQKLSVVAALCILVTSTITCWAVTERVLLKSALRGHGAAVGTDSWLAKLIKIFRQIWSTLLTLPPRIQAICWAVFWGWIGWYPFMVYSSTWVGETYFRYDVPADARASLDAVGDMGRIGSYALTAYSTVTVVAAGILPLLVRSPFNDSFTRRPPASIARFVDLIDKSRPDLLTVWTIGHMMFACSMLLAPFATSFRFATVLVTLCGIPWTVVTWAPITFLGIEVNKLTNGGGGSGGGGGGGGGTKGVYRRSTEIAPGIPLTGLLVDDDDGAGREALRLDHGGDKEATAVSTGELSGIYFGILNIYTTVPQFVGNLLGALVFAVLEPGKSPELAKDAHPSEHHSTDGPNAIAVTLAIGAVFAMISARATRKLTRL